MATTRMSWGGEVGEIVKGISPRIRRQRKRRRTPEQQAKAGVGPALRPILRCSRYSRFRAHEQQYSVGKGLERDLVVEVFLAARGRFFGR